MRSVQLTKGAAVYIVIRDYRGEASDVSEQLKQRGESLKEAMNGVAGLLSYYAADTENGGVASVTVVEDLAAAEESVRVAASWVRANMAQWAPNPPTIIQGEVVVNFSR